MFDYWKIHLAKDEARSKWKKGPGKMVLIFENWAPSRAITSQIRPSENVDNFFKRTAIVWQQLRELIFTAATMVRNALWKRYPRRKVGNQSEDVGPSGGFSTAERRYYPCRAACQAVISTARRRTSKTNLAYRMLPPEAGQGRLASERAGVPRFRLHSAAFELPKFTQKRRKPEKYKGFADIMSPRTATVNVVGKNITSG
ncbi:hypothetical protein B0H14DRAFT_2593450 [Mycena olivaceomarginata]|nr:hypothetical protein B0H14DRAFT_2593450 [Mycena olivaceomarginata]